MSAMSKTRTTKHHTGLIVPVCDTHEVLLLSPEDTDSVLQILHSEALHEPIWLSDSWVLLADTAAYSLRNQPSSGLLREYLLEPRNGVGLVVSADVYSYLVQVAIECDERPWKVSARQNKSGEVDITLISHDARRWNRTVVRRVLEVLR
jgi:hypothetical protein